MRTKHAPKDTENAQINVSLPSRASHPQDALGAHI